MSSSLSAHTNHTPLTWNRPHTWRATCINMQTIPLQIPRCHTSRILCSLEMEATVAYVTAVLLCPLLLLFLCFLTTSWSWYDPWLTWSTIKQLFPVWSDLSCYIEMHMNSHSMNILFQHNHLELKGGWGYILRRKPSVSDIKRLGFVRKNLKVQLWIHLIYWKLVHHRFVEWPCRYGGTPGAAVRLPGVPILQSSSSLSYETERWDNHWSRV